MPEQNLLAGNKIGNDRSWPRLCINDFRAQFVTESRCQPTWQTLGELWFGAQITDRLDSENRSPPIRVLKQAHEGLKRWLLA